MVYSTVHHAIKLECCLGLYYFHAVYVMFFKAEQMSARK